LTTQTISFDARFAMLKPSLRAMRRATFFARFALVQAKEDVVFVIGFGWFGW